MMKKETFVRSFVRSSVRLNGLAHSHSAAAAGRGGGVMTLFGSERKQK
jgi:hypothetical protein